jgi:hypothetical protein
MPDDGSDTGDISEGISEGSPGSLRNEMLFGAMSGLLTLTCSPPISWLTVESMPSWRWRLSPHEYALPAELRATVWKEPHDTSTTSCSIASTTLERSTCLGLGFRV